MSLMIILQIFDNTQMISSIETSACFFDTRPKNVNFTFIFHFLFLKKEST